MIESIPGSNQGFLRSKQTTKTQNGCWSTSYYCWWKSPEILHQLIGSLSHYLQGFSTIPGGLAGFLPSTVSSVQYSLTGRHPIHGMLQARISPTVIIWVPHRICKAFEDSWQIFHSHLVRHLMIYNQNLTTRKDEGFKKTDETLLSDSTTRNATVTSSRMAPWSPQNHANFSRFRCYPSMR